VNPPPGVEVLPQTELVGVSGQEGQGPFYVITLKIAEGRIAEASFRTYCCSWAIRIGETLTRRAQGRTLREAVAITEEEIGAALGGVCLPRPKRHLVHRAVEALRLAVARGVLGAELDAVQGPVTTGPAGM
jgi:nitrogen fixation NifU-like protein